MADFLAGRAMARFGERTLPKTEDGEQMRVLSALLGCLIVAETAGVERPTIPAAALPRIPVAEVA